MALPLPTSEQLFPAGGQLIQGGNAINDFRMKQLQNQYYGPNIESEMANRKDEAWICEDCTEDEDRSED